MTRITCRIAFLRLLIDEGVDHLFGNPGTTELPITEVAPDFPQLKFALALHESIVIGMDLRDPGIEFVALARSMGVTARRVADPQNVAPALREAMRDGGPQPVEAMIADAFGSAAAFRAS